MVVEFTRSPRESTGPRDRILDVFGSFVRDAGGWIAVADLIGLLESLGVSATAGRSALSRMKRRGELDSIERNGQRGYALTESAEQWFADGTPRIMASPSPRQNPSWVLAAVSVPEDNRSVRYQIRTRLVDLGFGQVAGGLMIAPAHIKGETMRALARAAYTDYVMLWEADHVGFGETSDIVARAWDLASIRAEYESYLAEAERLQSLQAPATEGDALTRYLANISAWRELPFADPEIPLAYLPHSWPRVEARSAFETLASTLMPAALRHYIAVTRSVAC